MSTAPTLETVLLDKRSNVGHIYSVPITLERIPHDKQVAIRALQLSGYSDNKIKKLVGVSWEAANACRRLIPSNSEEVESVKKQLIGESYGLSVRSWIRVTDEKLDAMNALQLTTIGAIGVDKARDIEGLNRPQFNIVNVVADCKQTRDKLEKQMSAINARKLALISMQMHPGEIT